MTTRHLTLLALLGSAGLLLGAYGFQHLGNLPPCKMCLWQRWPHGAAVVIGLTALWLPVVWLMLAGALAAAATSAIGFYHAGVELGWFEGPSTCTAGPVGGMSAAELLAQIRAAPVVRCDEVAWSLMGISMAGWNGIASAGLAGLWLWAAWRTRARTP